MRTLNLITCIDEEGYIGNGKNDLVTHIREDLKRFKQLTQNGVVVMGSNTFTSLGEKPLKNRTNIVITSRIDDYRLQYEQKGYVAKYDSYNFVVYEPSDEYSIGFATGLDCLENELFHNANVFIIGGSRVYRDALTRLMFDNFYITLTSNWNLASKLFIDKSKWVKFPMQELIENIKYTHKQGKDVVFATDPNCNPLQKDDISYKFYRIHICNGNDEWSAEFDPYEYNSYMSDVKINYDSFEL